MSTTGSGLRVDEAARLRYLPSAKDMGHSRRHQPRRGLSGGAAAAALLVLAVRGASQPAPAGQAAPAPPPLRLSNAAVTLAVVPALGARIVELRVGGGENLIDADPRCLPGPFPPAALDTPFAPWNGHTYWVGPQPAWWTQQDLDPARRSARATWPPDPFHETARYKVLDVSPTRIRLESPMSPV